jgi:hypothetical protein
MRDTIIDEVRKNRDQYARQFNYDLHAMCVDLRHDQDIGRAPVVSFSTTLIQQKLAQDGQADTINVDKKTVDRKLSLLQAI